MEHGADAVYLGFGDDTNACNFPGLNFDPGGKVRKAVAFAHIRGLRVLLALTTYPRPQAEQENVPKGALDPYVRAGLPGEGPELPPPALKAQPVPGIDYLQGDSLALQVRQSLSEGLTPSQEGPSPGNGLAVDTVGTAP